MFGRMLALVGLLAGCDHVFGLDDRSYVDAAFDHELCPASYSPAVGAAHRYRISMANAIWRDAEADCVDDSDLGITHLVTWSDAAELHALQAAYGAQFSFVRVHVGYARNVGAPPLQKESFFAVTGEVAPVDSWAPNEPDNASIVAPETSTSVTGAEDM